MDIVMGNTQTVVAEKAKTSKKGQKGQSTLKGGTDAPATSPVKVDGVALQFKEGGEPKPRWNLKPEESLISAAIQNNFLEYVEEGARDYVKRWLGYINPILIVVFSTNLRRLLKLDEVELLGGPDGTHQTCQIMAGEFMELLNAGTFEELPPEKQAGCRFEPGWGLRLGNEGVIIHLLNVMASGKPLDEALLFCKPGQISLAGNQLIVKTGSDPKRFIPVSGRIWYTTGSGETYFGYGRMGEINKALKVAKRQLEEAAKQEGREMDPSEVSTWSFDTFEMNLLKLLAPVRERQEQARRTISQVRAGVTNSVAQSLLMGRPLALASKTPIRR
jgi:hypothetical protein